MLKLILKIILAIFLPLWLFFFVWMGVSMFNDTDRQIKKDPFFITREIAPNIKSIDSFKTANHRLPTITEFTAIKHGNSTGLGKTNYIRNDKKLDNKIIELVKGTDWRNNYILAVWRGEWWEYYISASNKYVTNSYSQSDGAIILLICSIIGCIPIGLYLWFNRSKGKKQI